MLCYTFLVAIIGAPLVVAALLVCVTPAGARVTANGLTANGMQLQGISATAVAQNPANARITTGSALGDLNGWKR